MLKTKLFSVFKSMDIAELKRFQSFALSPYHNTNKTITRFLEYVEKYFHTLGRKSEAKRFNKEQIFQKIYVGTDFNDGTFAVLRSQTLSLLEEFFIIERFGREKKMQQKYLAEDYNQRNILRSYQNTYLKYEKTNLQERQTDSHWITHRLEILTTKMMRDEYDKLGKGYPLLLEVLEDLDTFYLHQKMRNEAVKANLDQYIKKSLIKNTLSYEKTIREQLDEYKGKSRVIGFYVRLRELVSRADKDIRSIEKFRKEFEIFSTELDYIDKDIIYFDLQNLVIKEYDKKGNIISPLLFDTYMLGIRYNLTMVNGRIQHRTFYNIVVAGGVAKRFEEVDKFVEENKDKIVVADSSSILLLVHIRILHDKRKKENWQEIVDLTLNFNHSDVNFRCYARSLGVRAFFMLFQEDRSYYYLLLSKMKAFKAFLSREKKALKKVKEQDHRLVFWLQKLTVAFFENKLQKDIFGIYDKIEKDERLPIFYREWLLGTRKT